MVDTYGVFGLPHSYSDLSCAIYVAAKAAIEKAFYSILRALMQILLPDRVEERAQERDLLLGVALEKIRHRKYVRSYPDRT